MTKVPFVMQITEDMSTGSRNQRKDGKKKKPSFKLGTFNVRGLTKDIKQEQLSRDVTKYKVDVLCIQETKQKELTNIDVEGNRLICLESTSPHYGNGFIVSKRWKQNIYKFWRVDDRISVLQLQTEKSKVKMNDDMEWKSRATSETTMILERNTKWRSRTTMDERNDHGT